MCFPFYTVFKKYKIIGPVNNISMIHVAKYEKAKLQSNFALKFGELPMMILLKNVECFCPEYKGFNDILVTGEKIFKIQPDICIKDGFAEKIYDCSGFYAFPGIIDQHLHITGGGGEEGFGSNIPEIEIKEIFRAGITTAVGLLGADGYSKNLESLYTKAKALEVAGISTFMYTGSYTLPTLTITGSIIRDMIFIDKVIGVKTAISDHRSSHPESQELIKIASQAHLGGMLANKAGVVHIHVGDGKKGLAPLTGVFTDSDLPKKMFVPTHLNRNKKLFKQAKEYCKSGGNIDLTAGEPDGIPVPEAVEELLKDNIPLDSVTVSSDSNGSIPNGGIGSTMSLYQDIISCITSKKIHPSTAFRLVTENAAKVLRLYPKKGVLRQGSDADILITDKNYNIKMLICNGRIVFEEK